MQELLRLTNKVLPVKVGKAVRDSVRENFRKGGVTAKMKGFFWAQHYRARGDMPELEVVDEDFGQLEMLQQEQQDTYPLTCPASMITMQSVSGIDNIGNPVNSLCIAKNL